MDSSPPTTSVYRMRMPRAGTLRNLFVRHNSAAGGVAGPITYVVLVNNIVNSVVVAQGDDVAIRASNPGSTAGVDSMVTLELA